MVYIDRCLKSFQTIWNKVRGYKVFRCLLVLTLSSFVLASCTSPQYKDTKNACLASWLKKLPPKLAQQSYMLRQSREVPTGRTDCYTTGNYTSCNQVMRTEYYSTPAVRTVDTNAAQRGVKIRSCTKTACIKKYGNSDCES